MSLLVTHYAAALLRSLPAAQRGSPEAQALESALALGDLAPAASALALCEREGLTPLQAARALGVQPCNVYRARAAKR